MGRAARSNFRWTIGFEPLLEPEFVVVSVPAHRVLIVLDAIAMMSPQQVNICVLGDELAEQFDGLDLCEVRCVPLKVL